jgi:hypothetical protein
MIDIAIIHFRRIPKIKFKNEESFKSKSVDGTHAKLPPLRSKSVQKVSNTRCMRGF